MALRPSIQFSEEFAPPSVTGRVNTGRAFVVGLSDRGLVTEAMRATSLVEFIRKAGDRVAHGTLYDWADGFFRSGGSDLVFARVVGPAAVTAKADFVDATPDPSIRISAKSPGEWGNALTASIATGTGGGTRIITITENGVTVESSPDLASADAAVAWSADSAYVTITKLGSLIPAVAASTALTGGTDDRANATTTDWKAGLDRFAREFGPGQVAYAGLTASQGHLDLKAHAASANRRALLDAPDTAVVGSLTSAVSGARGTNDTKAIFLAPMIIVPGIASGTTREIYPSAIAAGLIAKADSETGSANTPAAGVRGISSWALGVKRKWSDAEYDQLNTGGVMTFREISETVRLYGYRSLLSPTAAQQAYNSFNNSRLQMQIYALAEARAQNFLLQEITRRSLADLAGQVTGDLQKLYKAGAFFGDTPDVAYKVDTGPGVNTPETMSNREIHVKIQARMSQFAELITIALVFVPLTQEVQ